MVGLFSKAVVRVTVPRVRIPPSPPSFGWFPRFSSPFQLPAYKMDHCKIHDLDRRL